MNVQPSAATLLDAVVRCLREEALPQLEGRAAFNVRVSINALLTVARELAHGAAAAEREQAGLCRLLGHDGSVDQLREQLCDALARGNAGLDPPAVLAHLRATTLDQIAIDQPTYSAYLAAVAPGGTGASASKDLPA